MADGLVWPPTKEDLGRLYLVERLSASKIAKVYGLKYKNAKVAESTILYHLKRNGINRRGCTDHVRKVTEAMVDGWIERYQAGESLGQIAGNELSPVTVFLHLRKRGLKLRDKVEAQIQAVTKHERKPFAGDDIEKAYLVGLRYGDLDAVRHGRAVRVRVSTTHPAMAELFESLFSPYGMVHRYPREAKLTGYEWTLECDLDDSFEFLLKKPNIATLEKLNEAEFLAFLAGLFDAEGSVLLHKKRNRHSPEATLTNSDRQLVDFIALRLRSLGFAAFVFWTNPIDRRPRFQTTSGIARVVIWRFVEAQRFLRCVPIRHREKVAKARIVLDLTFGHSDASQPEIFTMWSELTSAIRKERNHFIQDAETVLRERNHPPCLSPTE